MKWIGFILVMVCGAQGVARPTLERRVPAEAARGDARPTARRAVASWYGEKHRGLLMANGRPFNPEALTGASWFYPFGTRVKVTMARAAPSSARAGRAPRSVVVTITDRGPAERFVRAGRVIDLSRAAFQKLAPLREGLVEVRVEEVGDDAARRKTDNKFYEKNTNNPDRRVVMRRVSKS